VNLSLVIPWLARALAIVGGVVLAAITIITVVSILGRAIVTVAYMDLLDGAFLLQWLRSAALWLLSLDFQVGSWRFRIGPIPGDFELVEAGTGFAVFSFLPWCQLNRGHATVDIFTSFLSEGANRIINLLSEILMTLAIALIAWRLWYGMMDKLRYGETTFILQYPIWWAYAACMAAAGVAVVVSLYMVVVRFQEMRTGSSLIEPGEGQGGAH
jgi:TRAP-type C4-dicarboxylate transport system permease small subunit